jgi:hippurate hydrolase
MNILADIAQDHDALTALRRDIHAHPELCFHEERTADVVEAQLKALGLEPHRGLGTTGVVAVITGRDGGASGRSIGLRADMDALPMQELNTFAHASQHPGKMHACGHDGHTAMLLGAARYLAKHRDFDGSVVLIFQPAEEGGGGAREMIQDGLFERFPMDAVFAIHNWPGLPVGSLAVSSGPVMASSNDFHIRVQGKGAHAAMPHLGLDPVPVACQIVQAFQTIITRNLHPNDTAVISVTQINAGTTTNVIPNSCEMAGTVRTFTLEVLDQIEQRMGEVVAQISAAFGMSADFTFNRNYPPTINHPAEAAFVRQVASEVFGVDAVPEQVPSSGAEDFSYMLMQKPGAYLFLGNGDGDHRSPGHGAGPCMLHNPSYDFNDALLPLGTQFWVRLVQRWLAQA